MKKDQAEILEFLGEIDLFICSSGFEKRATALPLILHPIIKEAIILTLNENYAVAIENGDIIKKKFGNIKEIEYPKNNSIETFDIFLGTLCKYEKNQKLKVVVDITTLTREILLILLKILTLKKFEKSFEITLVYTSAERYQDNWLTKGVREIRSIFGYSGMHFPSKKSLLIILNGFETERTEEIIDSFEANKIIIGKPSALDSINSELNSISNKKFEIIKEKYESNLLEEFEFSCTNISETEKVLNSIVEKYSKDFNIVISPLNNKISTLGAALVGLKNESVQICYASANQYNINKYSESSNYYLVYDLKNLLKK